MADDPENLLFGASKGKSNHMSHSLITTILAAVNRDFLNNAGCINIDNVLGGRRLCEPGVEEPMQNNPNN